MLQVVPHAPPGALEALYCFIQLAYHDFSLPYWVEQVRTLQHPASAVHHELRLFHCVHKHIIDGSH